MYNKKCNPCITENDATEMASDAYALFKRVPLRSGVILSDFLNILDKHIKFRQLSLSEAKNLLKIFFIYGGCMEIENGK